MPKLNQRAECEEKKFQWLQKAFVAQVALLVLLIIMMVFVSRQFDAKQRKLIASNLDLAKQLQSDEEQFNQQQADFVLLATQAAFDLRNAAKQESPNSALRKALLADSDKALRNALLADRGSWLAWREQAQAMIGEHRAQETLDDMLKAPIDKSDGRNLLTEALLECAMGRSAAARELVLEAQKSSSRPSTAELGDLNPACH